MGVSICGIVKNEARYLAEWLAYHSLIGFDRFYIYNNGSTDTTSSLLEKISEQIDLRAIDWPAFEQGSPQLSAYNDWLIKFGSKEEFCAFIDVDEFLVLHKREKIGELVKVAGEKDAAICISQRVFGSAGKKKYTPDLVINRFTLSCDEAWDENRWVKSIVRPSRIKAFYNPHIPVLRFAHDRLVDCDGRELSFEGGQGRADRFVQTRAQLNHYLLKSEEEYSWKRARGSAMTSDLSKKFSRHDEAFFTLRDANINKVPDLSAQALASDVVAVLESWGLPPDDSRYDSRA